MKKKKVKIPCDQGKYSWSDLFHKDNPFLRMLKPWYDRVPKESLTKLERSIYGID